MSDLQPMTCCTCAVEYGITPAMSELRLKDRALFYCPNGHSQRYLKPTVDPKDEELTNLKTEVTETVERLTKENATLTAELEVWKPRPVESNSMSTTVRESP